MDPMACENLLKIPTCVVNFSIFFWMVVDFSLNAATALGHGLDQSPE